MNELLRETIQFPVEMTKALGRAALHLLESVVGDRINRYQDSIQRDNELFERDSHDQG